MKIFKRLPTLLELTAILLILCIPGLISKLTYSPEMSWIWVFMPVIAFFILVAIVFLIGIALFLFVKSKEK